MKVLRTKVFKASGTIHISPDADYVVVVARGGSGGPDGETSKSGCVVLTEMATTDPKKPGDKP